MAIPMQVPLEFLARIQSGELIRYGTILKDAASGQIVGHLKETGNLSQILSMFPINPVSGILDLAANGYQAYQLNKLMRVMEVLQLTAGISAAASVVNLGVSVAGFAIVINKLNRIESKLDKIASGLEEIRIILDENNIKWEMMTMSKLKYAAGVLADAEAATIIDRKYDLLQRASAEFSKLRHFYFCLISRLDPVSDPALASDEVRDLYARYFTVAQGQLQSEFLLNDCGSYRSALNAICDESIELNSFITTDAYRARCDTREAIDVNFDFKKISSGVRELKKFATETTERMEGFKVELDYIEQSNISPSDYLENLQSQEPNIVLIPAIPRH